jgi:uncharacterized membrane protein YidH (DUF202 family)
LEYHQPSGLPGVRGRRIALTAVACALIAFPLGAGASFYMDVHKTFSHAIAERGGFMVFALGEGIAAALAFLAWSQARSHPSATRKSLWLHYLAICLGVAGSLVVLILIAVKAIT